MKRSLRISLSALLVGGVGIVGLGSVASHAGAQSLCDAFGDPYCPAVEIPGSDTVPAGGTVHIHGEGFDPNELVKVTLHSDPVDLGTFAADSAGVVDEDVVIPAGTAVGTHTIVMDGTTSGHTVEQTVEVTAAEPAGSDLPSTGSNPQPLVGIGLGLVAAGGSAAYAARRRALTAHSPS